MCKNWKEWRAQVQKDLGWTAGTKTGKVGGLNIKNRTGMQLLLNCSGPRVDSRKDEGLFNKMARPNQYGWLAAVGSRSEGQD